MELLYGSVHLNEGIHLCAAPGVSFGVRGEQRDPRFFLQNVAMPYVYRNTSRAVDIGIDQWDHWRLLSDPESRYNRDGRPTGFTFDGG